MVTRRKTHFWLEGDFEASDICIIRDSEKSTNPHTSPGKSTNNTPFCLALQTLTDEKDSYFLPNWIYSISSAGKASKSKAVYDSWQRALTDLNSELCEWTCLNGPLPCSWNMISREWKPFENFIFQRNTSSQRAAAWRHEAPSVVPDDETTCVLDSISPCIYLLLSKCLPVRLSDFPLYFLIVLISRKTHEYQQPLRNLMDLEWTWELKKHCNSSNILLSRGFIWMKLSWLQYVCSYTLVWMWRSSSFCAETMTSLNKRVVACWKCQSTA